MRPLTEIIDSVTDGDEVSYHEAYWSMLALHHIVTMHSLDLLRVGDLKQPFTDASRLAMSDNAFKRYKIALNADPQVWLGPNWDPTNPDVQRRRQASFNILERATNPQPKMVTNGSAEPTDKQMGLLRKLGCSEEPRDRQHASELIGKWLKK